MVNTLEINGEGKNELIILGLLELMCDVTF